MTTGDAQAAKVHESADQSAAWKPVPLRIGYPTSEQDWTPIASPGCLIEGRHLLEHAVRHFGATGEHYLTVKITPEMSRPVLNDETMAVLPLIDGEVSMRLVKLLV